MYCVSNEIFVTVLLCHVLILLPSAFADNKEKEYKPPGTVKYPVGDEQLNTNMLVSPAVNEAVDRKTGKLKDFSGKCPQELTPGASKHDNHIPCRGDGPQVPDNILYSSDSEAAPKVQCKKCDLRVTPDGIAVIVHCFECYDIPPPFNKMWHRNFIKFRQHLQLAPRLVRNQSQATVFKTLSEENHTDIGKLRTGEHLHGFEVRNIQDVPVFNITAVQLLHERTKSEYLHLYRNDSNNVFSVNFRTTPRDSTGLPHILEHIVLCGSKLYPIRDPFFKMLNRSLATFMNAMTGSDYTFYPFSTQNLADYRNLQKIYLDAVFRPNLKHLDFMQEGWRLENENPTDVNSDLIIKGVVYNEMKGAFSENENILMQKLQNIILPDHTYGVISGGDPLRIPNLTWEDLKKFHRDHYHPSNARFYSYGNFPLIPTLEYLNVEYLSKYEYQKPIHTVVPPQQRWREPKQENIICRFENMREPFEKQNTLCISLVMSDITDIYETFLICFVSDLLLKGPNASFYKSMIEPNFSGGFTPCTGYDTQPRDSIFTLGLQGLKKEDFDKVVTIFDTTIDEVVLKGFEEKHIESILHRYELSIKHESSNFGLSLLFSLTSLLNHNGDVISALQINKLIDRLTQELKSDKDYLQKVVDKYFKHNQHRLILTMSPDMDYESRQVQKEKQLILDKTKNLTNKDKEGIHAQALELLKEQSSEEDTSLLPTLLMDDIKSHVERDQCEKIRFGPVATQVNYANTNGITYFKGILSTSELSADQQMLLPLLCYIINKMGTDTLNYREFDSMMNRKTGGLNLDIHIAESLFQLHSYEPGILLSSHCLDKNVESMWELWTQIFKIAQPKDLKRFQTLVQLYMANLTHGLADSGHIYAMQAAGGIVSGAGYQRELLTGLQHIAYMKKLIKTDNYPAILTELGNMCKTLFDKNKLRCALNVSGENKSAALKSFEKFVGDLPGNTFGKPNEKSYKTTPTATSEIVHCQHHILNIPIHYCSKSVLTVPYTNPDYAKLRVLSRLLSARYLHPELREKQGAYGGGARITTDGVFSFYSYRDPHSFKTLDAFDNSLNWLNKEIDNLTSQHILEAKLGVFQSVDAPIPPSSKGSNEFLRGLTPDILQRHRAEIMAVDKDGLRQVGEKYLGFNISNSLIGKVILGPKSESKSKRAGEVWTVLDSE